MEVSNTIYAFKHNITGAVKYQAINVCFNRHYKLFAIYHLTSVYH